MTTISLLPELWGTRSSGRGKWSVLDDSIFSTSWQFRGRGRIAGTTQIKGNPNFPAGSRLVLIHEGTHRAVGSVYSTPSTGAYAFENYDHTQAFTVLAYDLAGVFRAAVANGVYPVLT